ncbi:MAG: hypothetical protein LBQ64_06695 [Bacteroidales bacterium]|nr:hypothetical protein [Bacteroidales bacterium]
MKIENEANARVWISSALSEFPSCFQNFLPLEGQGCFLSPAGTINSQLFILSLQNKNNRSRQKITKEKIYRQAINNNEDFLAFPMVEDNNIINEKGEIDYGSLRKTADAIERGTACLNRLSLAEERGRTKGNRRNVEASLILGRANAAERRISQESRESQRAKNEDDARKRQEQLLVDWAKHESIFEEYRKATQRTLFDLTGTEAKVYKGNNQDTVIKITFPYLFSNTPLEFLDNRISLHNYIFPETAYKLIGITQKGNVIAFILEQPLIDFTNMQNMDFTNPEYVEKYKAELEKRGLKMFEKDCTTIYNDDYIIDDIHENNILIDKADNFYFIDTVPQLNTSEKGFGGTREYGNGEIISTPTVKEDVSITNTK